MADDRRPALAASAALHVAVLGAGLIALRQATPLRITADAVPVSIVTEAAPNLRAALEAPEEASAAPEPSPTPDPAPPAAEEAPPSPPPPPAPTPKPRARPHSAPEAEATPPPTPTPTPTPTPRPPPKPKPAKPQPDLDLSALAADSPKSKPAKALDLASLSSSLASPRHAAGALDLASIADAPGGSRHAAGARGPAHAETAKTARKPVGAATALSGSEIGALTAKLGRLWNPNCGVEGSSGVVIRVRMRLGAGGELAGRPEVVGSTGDASDDVVRAAAVRAAGAVARGAPYTEISPEHLRTMNDFIFKFDARQVCNG